jgi:hypothetical protein
MVFFLAAMHDMDMMPFSNAAEPGTGLSAGFGADRRTTQKSFSRWSTISFCDQATQFGCVTLGQMINLLVQPLLVNRANLIYCHFGGFSSANDLESTLPMGMKLRGQGTDSHCLQIAIQFIPAHNNDWTHLADLCSERWVQVRHEDVVSPRPSDCHSSHPPP